MGSFEARSGRRQTLDPGKDHYAIGPRTKRRSVIPSSTGDCVRQDHRQNNFAAIFGIFILIACIAARAQTTASTRPTLDPNLGVEDLIKVLNEPAWGDRNVELFRKKQAIGEISASLPDAKRAIPSLLNLLHDPGTARLAAGALVGLGDAARDEILKAARDSDPAVRAQVVRAISPMGTDAEPLLVDLSRNDADPAVRIAATNGLLAIGSAEAGPPLLAMLSAGSNKVRVEAAQSIWQNPNWPLTDAVAAKLAECLLIADRELREPATFILEREHNHPKQVLPGAYQAAERGADGGAAGMRVIAAYPATRASVVFAAQRASSQNGQTSQYAMDLLRRSGPLVLSALPPLATLASAQHAAQSGNVRAMLFDVCSHLPGHGQPQVPPELSPMTPQALLDALVQVANDEKYSIAVRAIALEPLSRWGPKAGWATPAAIAILRSQAAVKRDRQIAIQYLTNHAPGGYDADNAVVTAIEANPDEIAAAGEQYMLAAGPAFYPMIARVLSAPREPARLIAIHVCAQISKPDRAMALALCRTAISGYGDVRSETLRVLQSWLTHHPSPDLVEGLAPEATPLRAIAKQDGADAETIAEIVAVIDPPPPPAQAVTEPIAAPTATAVSAAPAWREPRTIAGVIAALGLIAVGAMVLPRRILAASAITSGPSVIAERSGTRIVRCEKCSREYGYDVRRKVARSHGGATVPLAFAGGILGALIGAMIDNMRGNQVSPQLREKLEREVKDRVDRAIEVVPCPDCGWHQQEMVRELRRRTRISQPMQLLLALAGISLIAVLFLAGIRADRYTANEIPVAAVWMAAGALAFFLTAYLACWIRTGQLDINAGWPMKCPRCQLPHARLAQFCRRCGLQFGADAPLR